MHDRRFNRLRSVQGVGRIRFPVSPTTARKLAEVARPARHGFKDQTRLLASEGRVAVLYVVVAGDGSLQLESTGKRRLGGRTHRLQSIPSV
jgi:hypothetical protein